MCADSDVYINSDNWNTHNNHMLAYKLHELIAAKKMILIASQSGRSRVINLQKNFCSDPEHIPIGDDEVLVGVYSKGHKIDKESTNQSCDQSIYVVDFPNKSMKFY